MTPIAPAEFRALMGRFATGVTVISYRRDGLPAGMTANAFLPVSMDPPLVLVSVRRSSQFNDHVRVGTCYGVNFLAESQQALSMHFGGRPIEGLMIPFVEQSGTPLIEGSLVQMVARVVDVHVAGDHCLHIARIEHLQQGVDAKPLIFYSGAYKQIQAHEPPRVLWQCVDGW